MAATPSLLSPPLPPAVLPVVFAVVDVVVVILAALTVELAVVLAEFDEAEAADDAGAWDEDIPPGVDAASSCLS